MVSSSNLAESESIPFQGKTASGWGIGDDSLEETDLRDANAAWCRHQLPITTSSPYMGCDGKLSSYLRFPVEDSAGDVELLEPDKVPEGIKAFRTNILPPYCCRRSGGSRIALQTAHVPLLF